MKFGAVPVSEALGCILAHSLRLGEVTLKKGKALQADDVALLQAQNVAEVVVARLDDDDVPEDEAAALISRALAGSSTVAQAAFTGRANVFAAEAGLVKIDKQRLNQINHLHESLTVATLSNWARVSARDMVATVKIIPYALPRTVLDQALEILSGGAVLQVEIFKSKNVGVVLTQVPRMKAGLLAKSEKSLRDRIAALKGEVAQVVICDHQNDALLQALKTLPPCDVILIFGAVAIVDRADVVPAAVVAAGGAVLHMGMPVDPGNLLMLAAFQSTPVIGVPTCARSPKLNGFDWVLARVMAGLEVTPEDIMEMGLGGLLAEIPSRPQPRESQAAPARLPRVAALVLAAGTSSRMGRNKLLEPFQGQAMVGATVARVKASVVDEVMVVTGHQAEDVRAALAGHDVTFVHNSDFAQGLSTSLKAGVAALRDHVDAILVCLGDMPLIEARDINAMIAAYNVAEERHVVVPVHGRRYGNPILWGSAHFDALMACEGDRGARGLLERLAGEVVEIEINHPGVVMDADTPEALAAMRQLAAQI
ncbi:MAG: molybdopterin-binding/glycosyltransferase family 2 protein [Alphaproteobacteria bacterium]|nr:molybdopterin-binding/glycosyltransferase family 2 protein [Alphaproteobacteria bacterium]